MQASIWPDLPTGLSWLGLTASALALMMVLWRRGYLDLRTPPAAVRRTALRLGDGVILLLLLVMLQGLLQPLISSTPDPSITQTVLATLLMQVAVFAPVVGLAWFLARRGGADPHVLGWWTRPQWRDLWTGGLFGLLAVLLGMSVLFTTNLLATLLGDPPDVEVQHVLLELYLKASPGQRMLLAFMAIGTAPLTEELFFRGVLQSAAIGSLGWRRGVRWWATISVGLLFAAVHWASIASWHPLPTYVALACVFGVAYERTGRIWPAVLAHAVFNGVNLVFLLLAEGAGA